MLTRTMMNYITCVTEFLYSKSYIYSQLIKKRNEFDDLSDLRDHTPPLKKVVKCVEIYIFISHLIFFILIRS